MPTFTANRSSSAILKNVLHEESSTVTVLSRPMSTTRNKVDSDYSPEDHSSNVQGDLRRETDESHNKHAKQVQVTNTNDKETI